MRTSTCPLHRSRQVVSVNHLTTSIPCFCLPSELKTPVPNSACICSLKTSPVDWISELLAHRDMDRKHTFLIILEVRGENSLAVRGRIAASDEDDC